MAKEQGELPRVTVALIKGHVLWVLKFPFEQQRRFGFVYYYYYYCWITMATAFI